MSQRQIPRAVAAANKVLQSLEIQSFSYEDRQTVLPSLSSVIADCGGWILQRKSLSAAAMEFQLEIQLRSVIDFYACIAGSGLELTRSGHAALASLCTSRRNIASLIELGQIVVIRLEIRFLDELALSSTLATGVGLA